MECILWDIDDVLVDTTQRLRQGQAAALECLGLDGASAALNAQWQQLYWYFSQAEAADLIRALLTELGMAKPDQAITAAAKAYHQHAQQGPFIVHTGIRAALDWAQQQGIVCGVVSNGDRGLQMTKLTSTGLISGLRSDLIEVRTRSDRPKPHPDGIQTCLARAGVAPQRAVYIGNRYADILAANLAGCRSVLVNAGSFDFQEPTPRLGIEQPTTTANTTRDLLPILQAWAHNP